VKLLFSDKPLFRLLALSLMLSACAPDSKVNYSDYPQLKEARDDFGALYLEMYSSAASFHHNDIDALHAELLKQRGYMYRVRALLRDSTPHYYPALTAASAREVFEFHYRNMQIEKSAVESGDKTAPAHPLISWSLLHHKMSDELSMRQKRVMEMRNGTSRPAKDDSSSISRKDTLLPGFSVLPTL
jgi:hypothetical protein